MKKIYILVLTGLLWSFSGCNKWLDVKPLDGLIQEEFFKTKEQLASATVACYGSLLDGGNKKLVEYLFVWGELRADLVEPNLIADPQEIDFSTYDILSSNPYVRWDALYNTIRLCNIVIENGPKVLESDNTLTSQQLNAYLSEAHGIRALMYFYLLRTFGEAPLRTKGTLADGDLDQMTKSSREEIAAFIVNDLEIAEAGAVNTYGRQDYNKGRITRYTINAIQADVFMWLERYNEALIACNKIIDSRLFGLVAGTDRSLWFNTLYVNGNSAEAIFEFQFDAQKTNPFYSAFVAPGRFSAREDKVEDIFGMDPSNPNNSDIRGDQSAYYSFANYMIWKYNGISAGSTGTISSSQSFRHWFMYRYAEILLFKAEALVYANPGDVAAGTEALALVERIRQRAKALPSTAEEIDPANSNAIAMYILRERSREFAFEGKRWYDLLRYAKRNNYTQLDILLDMVVETAPPEKQQTALAKFRDVRSHYLPIHDLELGAGKLLTQNPYYE